jgi:hypothetical protein
MAFDWFGVLMFVILCAVMYLVYRLIIYGVNRVFKGRKYSIDALNGIKLVLRIFFAFLVSFLFFTFLGINSELLISISSISGLIIGFSTTEIMSQIVSGLYLMVSRPFTVHDLVKIGGIEGIVLEIGINRVLIQMFDGTFVKIPNKKVFDAEIKNYTLKLTKDLEKRQILSKSGKGEIRTLMDAEKEGLDMQDLKNILGNLTDFMSDPEVTRYTFDFEVDISINPYEAFAILERVCKKYTEIYQYKPKCFIIDLGFRAEFRCRIYCTNPRTIMHNHSDFLEDITLALYGSGEEV